MDEAGFLQTVHEHLVACTEDGALGVNGYMWSQRKGNAFGVHVLDVEPPAAWLHFMTEISKDETLRAIMYLDRYAKPHQGTSFGDLVAGMYIDKRDTGWAFRPFICEYQAKPVHRCLWFNWANLFWNGAVKIEMLGTIRAVQQGTPLSDFINVGVDENGEITPYG